jgi:hypothetical protein
MTDYFWTPRSHGQYKQECAIYLIRLKYPFLAVIDDIESLANSACLSGYRIYSLYGPEDFIVIARAQAQKLDSFAQLSEADHRFRNILRFDCIQSLPRLSDDRQIDAKIIEQYHGLRAYDPDQKEIDDDELVKLGLKIRIPKHRRFRFFTHFQLPPNPVNQTSLTIESQFIVDLFKKFPGEKAGFHISVYVKKVDGKPKEFIAETLCDEYDAYYDTLGGMKTIWEREKITCVTYVVSSPNVREVDRIDVNWNGIHERVLGMLRFLQHSGAFRAYVEQTEKRSILDQFYIRNVKFTENHSFESTLRELLVAFLMNDREYLLRALTITVKIEGYFWLVLQHVWREIHGKNEWYKIVKNALEDMGQTEEKPTELTINVACKIQESRSRLNELFGEDWAKKLQSITGERNDFAHGRAATSEDALTQLSWEKTAQSICNVAELYHKVVVHYETHVKKDRARTGQKPAP